MEIKVNEKGEIVSPTYPELVSKINELIEKSNQQNDQFFVELFEFDFIFVINNISNAECEI